MIYYAEVGLSGGICTIGKEGGFLCFAVVVYITNFHLFGRIVWYGWWEGGEKDGEC